ncbi:MAG: cysteine dioxygenase [Cupriavidus sp.]|jgi:predicted metal-dependent enzyme (double-stranded beta helix superfamily)|uniref:cysteine dioxygenase family protein n=1 Tax=Cupriavidus pauculus TaxID=82633 RepID=UPI000785E5BF|nr:cysteine dioxygenase family protein [Cupriavidus pauculus]MBU64205.1 cysteine dioxygenase [Cupriavidus sp.]KAB0603221.1 cysteine dioxygenase [Cupriavidus pauculus]MBY4732454.1 cysteine dioxygenase family protein [Cupriavidus pauculus]MCM3604532.1 cysteine dioxygenase family protein [Cupriavidus pauculus]UAK98578.1 cysteine dioxygenase family protein [Cupriavidus pauculus]
MQQAAPSSRLSLNLLASGMEATLAQSARMVAAHVAASLPDTDTLLASLPPGALDGSPATYTRHLVHADPFERYSVMLLVWRPGQHSPVHGHRTWCAYRVLRGTLSERHYRWNPDNRTATQVGAVTRGEGDTFSVPAGLQHIHALGNDSDAVAVSLHIYGVDQDRIATGVNLLVDTIVS